MVIGINSQINGGKDTVALMSALLHYHVVTGMEFPTVEDYLKAEKRSVRYDVQIKKYASALRQVAEVLTGIEAHRFEDRDFKENFYRNNLTGEIKHRSEIPRGAFIVEAWKKRGYKENSWVKIRVYLQDLGTDAVRRRDQHAWVNALFSKYDSKKDIWAISDMRFPNEFDRVQYEGGATIEIIRPSTYRTDYENLHESETALHGRTFDFRITNDGDLMDLMKKVHAILEQINFYDTERTD